MIGRTSLSELTAHVNLVPQAIIKEPVSAVAQRINVDPEHGEDSFDRYEGIAIVLDGSLQCALMHYDGHPADTFTIYLPFAIRDLNQISELIARNHRRTRYSEKANLVAEEGRSSFVSRDCIYPELCGTPRSVGSMQPRPRRSFADQFHDFSYRPKGFGDPERQALVHCT